MFERKNKRKKTKYIPEEDNKCRSVVKLALFRAATGEDTGLLPSCIQSQIIVSYW